jgi:tetratricopeptide (TPR) repeat protein
MNPRPFLHSSALPPFGAALAALLAISGCGGGDARRSQPPAPQSVRVSGVPSATALPGPDDDSSSHPSSELEPGLFERGDPLALLPTPHHDARFHDHYQEAVLLREQQRFGEASDALRMQVFDAPEHAVAWLLLAETYQDLGRAGTALLCADHALSLERDLPAALRLLARIHLERGEPELARPFAERWAAIAPEDSAASHNLARVYLGLSMWEQAIAQGKRSIRLSPESPHAYNQVGFAALQLGRNELALQFLEAGSTLSGFESYMWNNLGVAYERSQRTLDALQAFARAAELDPGSVKALANRERMRAAVDREVADEVARVLREQIPHPPPAETAAAPLEPGDGSL